MKTTTIFAFALMLFISACGSDTKQQDQQDPAQQETMQEVQMASFYCPMKCEGEKTYEEKGSCPTCGMDLVEVEGNTDTEIDPHEGHNHD